MKTLSSLILLRMCPSNHAMHPLSSLKLLHYFIRKTNFHIQIIIVFCKNNMENKYKSNELIF